MDRTIRGLVLILLLFPGIQMRYSLDTSLNPFGITFIFLKVLLFSANYFWLYPKFFRSRRYGKWIIAALLAVLATTILRYSLEEMLAPVVIGKSNYYPGTSKLYYLIDNFFWLSPWILLSTVIRLIEEWIKMGRDRQVLEQQRTEAELALLKSQLNPHFLFNTLNSIYSLAYQKSEKAPDAILKLSEVMRYMLYDSEDQLVPLEKELQYLHSFVDLQKARFKENIYVDLLVEGTITTQQITPVILIAFVENAFKHGVLNDPTDPVLIQVTINGCHLQLMVQNKVNDLKKDQTGGIGLPNIYRRLELLYPGRHRLEIRNTDTHYICELSLEL